MGISRKAVVIGAGIGGLAAAARLACKGYAVTVIEAADRPGGKATYVERDGFYWGFGPSLLTLPELIDEVFLLCNRNPRDYFNYRRLDPVCRYFYEDGTCITAHADAHRFAQEVQLKTGEPAENVLHHLLHIANVYELTKELFLQSSLHRLRTYLRPSAWKALARLPAIGVHRSMHRYGCSRFTDVRVIQLFDRYATYNGSNPYAAPSTLHVTAHPEYNLGAYFAEGGMPQIPHALYRLASELGVKFLFGARAERILVSDGRAVGVKIQDETLPADVIISNMDVVLTYRQLLPDCPAPTSTLEQPRSTSGLIFYWGVRGTFPTLSAHNIFFSSNYPEEFRHLTSLYSIYKDPTVYIFISKKLEPGHAPDNCENWFVLINAPHDSGQDWDTIVQNTRKNVIAKLSRMLQTDIETHIITEVCHTPLSIEAKTLSYKGALYGSASNSIMSAFLRHPNFSQRIKGLYFCGGSVHPGGGIPLCLLSAKIIDELLA
ncbi:MAG: phytoene desaturase family protein [Chitinophagales bacterium]|nr:phytoene desaturase family protein [Chitinophagales bacterium]MDW8419040.1 1-hydroxycarotenoid 3,4-desaturase CrtD [Chitinophagales bacterium]